ncbi:hypothetical protein CC1G_14073 [Coprinopsis cinerea okayama7|uniref:Uncharacterized protein n=1 Tax=Coprinopsis cinerea (strain Okayama-7 / 130 / ATCC MYA-4618 / FGSC 9003) TaxID=240176 RepID=D6RL46_COPC7|nr:hypothetical protein CC1G_14073 [Coprinopsis cinerea okayama7\|eukprot:XP_002911541.1 hypothetical protein CC1G_14073 [Coprinopsis cinerea okayama7\
MSASRCATANPDISGIGVRLAIYIQASLSLLVGFALTRLDDRSDIKKLYYGRKLVAGWSGNLSFLGCALLLAGLIEEATATLGIYHAIVILYLSWIIHISSMSYIVFSCTTENTSDSSDIPGWKGWLRRRDDLPLGLLTGWVVHGACLGAFGIYVWKGMVMSAPRTCTSCIIVVVLGKELRASDPSLRVGSLIIYSLAIVPFVIAIIPALLCVVVYGVLDLSRRAVWAALLPFDPAGLKLMWAVSSTVGVGSLLAVLIANAEMTIVRNSHLNPAGRDEESRWTFGQTLAMIMVLSPLVEVAKAWTKGIKRLKTAEVGSRIVGDVE